MALDLGGTNFRVLVIFLDQNHFDMQSKIYAIPEEIMTGTGLQVGLVISKCVCCQVVLAVIYFKCDEYR